MLVINKYNLYIKWFKNKIFLVITSVRQFNITITTILANMYTSYMLSSINLISESKFLLSLFSYIFIWYVYSYK